MIHYSAIDFTKPNIHEEFPLHSKAKYTETVLFPGDAIYIPRWCWHLIVSIDEATAREWLQRIHKIALEPQELVPHCISVSFWWGKRMEKPSE